MTTCILVLGIISCVLTAPRPTPAEAAKILTASSPPYVYVAPAPRAYGPIFVASHRQQRPEPMPERRLDGTLWTDPPVIYGLPPWWAYRPGIRRTR